MPDRGLVQNYIFPEFGSRPLDAIHPADVLALVKRIATAKPHGRNRRLPVGGARTAENVRWIVSRVYSWAVLNLRTKVNPARELRGAINLPQTKHHPSLKAKELPHFFKQIDGYDGRPETRVALKLLILTFVRANELAGATWDEIDFAAKEWRIPAGRMKMKEEHSFR